MEIVEISEYKNRLIECKDTINQLRETLKMSSKKEELSENEKKITEEGFWNDEKGSAKVLSKVKELKSVIGKIENIESRYEECIEMVQMLENEYDEEFAKELKENTLSLEKELELMKVQALLSDEYDDNVAIVTIHPGAGGTESQDWALMLYRMYTRWAERTKHSIEIYDMQDGDEAGLKSVTFSVKGEFPYGYLKGEKGVHRLVRISPFDSNSRRHTSFAAVDVLPEIDDSISIEIRDEDLEIGTFRASGAGGQHINKTDSAVRIKHIPTGIVASCQTERSQFQNKDNAMKMLKAKLYQLELEKNKERINQIKGDNSENGWGSQIRSYVFCPYTLVKDHRTGFELGNVQKVMDGYIDDFIYEYLKSIKIKFDTFT